MLRDVKCFASHTHTAENAPFSVCISEEGAFQYPVWGFASQLPPVVATATATATAAITVARGELALDFDGHGENLPQCRVASATSLTASLFR